MAKPKIFIIYENDKHYKKMLVAWDKNDESDFAFIDHSADVSIQSTTADAIKRSISAQINSATHFLCIVGFKTSKSDWMAWEIDKAKELKKELVAAKTASDNTTPSGLLNGGRVEGDVVHIRRH